MLKRYAVFIVAFVLVVFLVACGSEKNPLTNTNAQPAEVGTDDYKELVPANNALAFKLLTGAESKDGNVFVSPTSLLMALSMVYNGAEGETKEEMSEALQLKGIDAHTLNKANASFIQYLQEDSEAIQLAIANSIWLNKEFQFQKEFRKNNEDYFDAEIEEIDIHDDASADQINEWVSKATNGKIEEMVEAPLKSNLVTYLLNAMYFKGDWTYEFDEDLTETAAFHLANGETIEVSKMTLAEDLHYTENDLFQAVELPYGEETMKMQVYLPKESTALQSFYDVFTVENWTKWNAQFEREQGTVKLPKFTLDYEIILNELLENLGMKLAFEDSAEFTKMIEGEVPVSISEVKQKTFIEVNEKGTEAAAVTSVEVEETSASIDEPFVIDVNRPFILTIVDEETDAILFLGEIAHPKVEER